MRVLTLPWAFGGSVPPTTRTLPRAAPPGGPHGRLGRRSRFPISPYPPWRPAAPRTGHDFGSGGACAVPVGPFRKGKWSRTPTGYLYSCRQAPTCENVPAALAAGRGRDRREGRTPNSFTLPRHHRRTNPSPEYVRVARSRLRQAVGRTPVPLDMQLPTRRLPWRVS